MIACGVFAAVCSNSVITAMTMGKIAYPEMKKYK
jgi:TRAP-type C4-dicarboxylate transport system permease large subunit